MKLDYTKAFQKQFAKLGTTQQATCAKRLEVFRSDPNHPLLRRHPLRGEWKNHYSISAGGDLRLHYRQTDAATAVFVAVGTHSQLYK